MGSLALGGSLDQNLCPLFCWVPRNSHSEFSAVGGRKSRGVIWDERGELSEERRDVWFACVRGRDRQTDRQGECAAESSSEIQGRCSHRNTLCSVVMAHSSTAHSCSLWEPEYFGDIFGLCLRASAQGVHMHISHVSGVNTRVSTSIEIPGKWHGVLKERH